MSLPEKDQHLSARTLGRAVQVAHRFCPKMDAQAVVCFYPSRSRLFAPPEPVPFSFYFFTDEGKNFATYIPDLEVLMVYSRTREWLIEKPGTRDVRDFFPN